MGMLIKVFFCIPIILFDKIPEIKGFKTLNLMTLNSKYTSLVLKCIATNKIANYKKKS